MSAVAAPSASDLVRYSTALGARALRRRGGREAPWRIWMPVDMDRVVELPWTARAVAEAEPGRVLDIASPKLLACWLAEHLRTEVVATDLWAAEISRWRQLVRAADPTGRRFSRLRLEPADVTGLPYETASFDVAFSVSVIEHVADDGDSVAMAELARVVRPGGLVVLTVPYAAQAAEVRVEQDLYGQRYVDTPLFFYRCYSPDTLASRLLDSGQFDVLERAFWSKRHINESQAGLRRVVPARFKIGPLLGPALPVLGLRAMRLGDVEDPGPEGVLGLVLRRRP